jgi:uncharacterized membrane protein
MRTGVVEARLARVLSVGSRIAVGLLAIGIVLMIGRGLSPLDLPPALALDRLVSDLVTLHPAGFLWLGAVAIMALPIIRLVVAGASFWQTGERSRALLAAGTLTIIAIGVVLGLSGRT